MSVTLDDDEVIPGLRPDGRPDPAYAASLGIVAAHPGRRAAAFAIDAVVYVLLLLPLFLGAVPTLLRVIADDPDPSSWSGHPDFRTAAIFWIVGQGLVSIFTIVQLALHGLKGVTVGKAVLGLRSVNVATFGKPGFWRVVLRALVLSFAFSVIPYLGAIPFLASPLWDPERRGRGWLDRIGRNWIIDARRGLDPADSKALRQARRALAAPVLADAEALPSLATGTAWAGPTFVPAARSSSGVVSLSPPDGGAPAWEPPPFGVPEPAAEAPSQAVPTPATPLAAPAPLAAPLVARAATLAFNDGLRFDIDGEVLLGRNPAVRPDAAPVRLLQVDDPARQLSKTHLAVGIDASGVWISDQGSSNGTFVTDAAGRTDALSPFTKTYISPGTVVALGDRTFVVTPKDAP